MRKSIKIFVILFLAIGFGLSGYLGYTCYELKVSRDGLADDLVRAESRIKLLSQKYKENKAQVGRLQRESLALNGKLRQAKLDLEKAESVFAEKFSQKSAITDKLKGDLKFCSREREQLTTSYKELQIEHKKLNLAHRQTSASLSEREKKLDSLNAELQSLNSELKQITRQSERYEAHNLELAKIATQLVGRVERKELGSSVLVREPLIQFERVNVEKLLQEYLDKIDEETNHH